MKKKGNPLAEFLIGLAMLAAGGYWFLNSVSVSTGFYTLRLGGFYMNGGLVVVPFIAGVIWFDGKDLTEIKRNKMNDLRVDIQLVFQDPYSSLPPRMTVGSIISEAVKL